MDTEYALGLLQKALQDLCVAFNQKRFFPLLEADVAAYLYHQLLENGCPLPEIHSETRICGMPHGERRFDLAIGTVDTDSGCVRPILVIQIKAFQRWGHSSQQHKRRFEKILSRDIESLKQVSGILPSGRVEVVADFVVTPQLNGYLNGKWKGRIRRDILSDRCKEANIALFWIHPDHQDRMEPERVA